MGESIDPRAPGAIHGRGTAVRIAHRYERQAREAFFDGWPEDEDIDAGAPPPATTVRDEQAGSILSRNDSPDIPFELAINPYRGCEHGCIYCYARPTHSYLDLSPGLDFETKLVAKVNAAELLKRELGRRGYVPSPINIGSATDAYQPIERRLRLTRAVLEVLCACEHPFTIVTKSAGIERDLDLIAPAARRRQAQVFISVTTLDAALARRLEPRAASPRRRLLTVRRLADAGVPVDVNLAPVIPFINEPEIEDIVAAAAEAGARAMHYTVLRLPWEVAPLFRQWLDQHFPERAARVMARVQEMRGGKDYDADFSTRMKGAGIWAELIRQRVWKAADKRGMTRERVALDASRFRPPGKDAAQGALF
ncbi:MAG TPA: PA0069 family radical SAM protein [Methylibium sp.]|uniref:PA0069 family radical SAM protein n=1 Tax=Methylibium sp. TaxID=2067992 RepID=UPI002DB594BD|nr:PA0069 family radical SAM protein [Methylibium sp.]HEU4458012.1 PA0069 family radical SAM protein [Methylibium sp.]